MKRAIWKLVKEYLLCVLAVLCLCAAGSDGDYFPWVNIVGTLVLVIMAMVHLKNREGHHIRAGSMSRVWGFLSWKKETRVA